MGNKTKKIIIPEDTNKAIFIHIPKTGGMSIRDALYQKVKIIGHHISASAVKSQVDNWDSTFKFSVVRNPWERMVSAFFFGAKKESKWILGRTFDEWVFERLYAVKNIKTQCDFLMEDGKIIVDFVARFENLQKDFKKICSELGIRKKLAHRNKTRHKHYSYYYSHESEEIIADLFRDDIEFFGYEYKEHEE